MSTVIRSRSGWFETEGAVLECRRQGADVQLRSGSSSSNPLVWDIDERKKLHSLIKRLDYLTITLDTPHEREVAALLLTRRGAWTLFVGSRQVKQLIEMSTVIRSRSGWFETEGAVLECRRQGADVQLRSGSSSSNPLVWDIE
ncbi:hypothetical protein J6590_078410 [Homalodisca vitripennis]|nr:hypothetical protein J6590_078410 [Homalodisca vitripennis]